MGKKTAALTMEFASHPFLPQGYLVFGQWEVRGLFFFFPECALTVCVVEPMVLRGSILT